MTFGIIRASTTAWTVSICTSPTLLIIAVIMFVIAIDDRRYRRETYRWMVIRDLYEYASKASLEQLQYVEWGIEQAFPGQVIPMTDSGKPMVRLWTGSTVSRDEVEEVKASVTDDGELPPLREVDTPGKREIYHALRDAKAIEQEPGQAPTMRNWHLFEQVLRC